MLDESGRAVSLHDSNGSIETLCMGTAWRDEIRDTILGMVRDFGLAYVKLDLAIATSAYVYDPARSGCCAKDHPFHRDREESFDVIYTRCMELFDELHAAAPELYIDCTFETAGKMHLMDYGIARHADGNWLSNIEEDAPVGSFRVRDLAWKRALALPPASLVVGNLRMDAPNRMLEERRTSRRIPPGCSGALACRHSAGTRPGGALCGQEGRHVRDHLRGIGPRAGRERFRRFAQSLLRRRTVRNRTSLLSREMRRAKAELGCIAEAEEGDRRRGKQDAVDRKEAKLRGVSESCKTCIPWGVSLALPSQSETRRCGAFGRTRKGQQLIRSVGLWYNIRYEKTSREHVQQRLQDHVGSCRWRRQTTSSWWTTGTSRLVAAPAARRGRRGILRNGTDRITSTVSQGTDPNAANLRLI